MGDGRPNPDALLEEVQQEEVKQKRGKLKVFFGMSAGVGKTYAMLEEARKRAQEGAQVLIGYAEPHIRPDTESLLLGMEILPYKIVEYRNASLKEFDLDAALARKPAIVCVDELAHTNAPGMRHPKRWQDVVELLDAGINVYTTLNVQHLESVNDIVQRITSVEVRETLPDKVLEQADEVELVDIAPEELLERFREGKVYRPEQAERAARHFFTKGNLIALRELALRKTAERVDEQMLDYRRDQRVQQVIPASERVLVCVGPSPFSARLIRSARRLAAGVRGKLIAAYVEKSAARRLSDQDRHRLEQNLRLAEELGAQTVALSGANVADEVLAYAASRNVTKIVVGKPVRSKLHDFLFGSVVDDLVRRSGEIDIYVIRGEAQEDERAETKSQPVSQPRDWRGYLAAVMVMGITTALGWPMYHHLGIENENVLMLYLLGVLWVATHHTRSAAVLASVLAVAAFDLVFVPPHYTFAVSDRQYVVVFVVMLLTALVISALAYRVRAQADAARQRERRTSAVLSLARELSVARTAEQALGATVRHVVEAVGGRCAMLLPDAGRRLVLRTDSIAASTLDAREMGVAQWAFEHGQQAGRNTETLPAAAGRYMPLIDSRGSSGVLALFPSDDEGDLPSEQRQLVEAFCSQTALALERVSLADEARSAWERVEAEFLRNTLLSGVSHELRTPLAAITGAATSLLEPGGAISADSRRELIETIRSESDRMERLITNLLDMTRMESGGLVVKKEWLPLQEVIGSTLNHLESRLADRTVNVAMPTEMPLVQMDGILIEQVLTNLIDNAIEYTPPQSPIDIVVHVRERELEIEVADRGPGLPAGTEKRVFEKFFRIQSNQTRRGIGLGLAIVRGIVESHGGQVIATNRPGGGAIFRFTLPLTGAPPAVKPEV